MRFSINTEGALPRARGTDAGLRLQTINIGPAPSCRQKQGVLRRRIDEIKPTAAVARRNLCPGGSSCGAFPNIVVAIAILAVELIRENPDPRRCRRVYNDDARGFGIQN